MAFLLSTTGVAALWGARLIGVGPSIFALALASFAWGVLVTSGVFFPWLEMYGPVVCRGPQGGHQVALTFDDGPHPQTTRKVLAALAGTRHRATFFVLGNKVRQHPEVVLAIREAGHVLALHGDVHDRLHSFRGPWRVRNEILRAQAAVEAITGFKPTLFRPPVGHTTPATMLGARMAGVTPIGWSARGYDGMKGRTPEAVLREVERSLRDGALILLHDAAERDDFEPASIGALPELLRRLDARGLTSVTLDRWPLDGELSARSVPPARIPGESRE